MTKKNISIIKIIVFCFLIIIVLYWILDYKKPIQYEKIREASKKEISNISEMESEKYIKKIDVEFDYKTKDNYLDSKSKLYSNYTTFTVSFDESFAELYVRDKAAEIVKYDYMIHKNYIRYLEQAGHNDFIKKNGGEDNYFEVNNAKFFIDNDYNVKYYCGTEEYSLYPFTLYITDLKTCSKEQYDIKSSYGILEQFEKHYYSNNDNTQTKSSDSVSKKNSKKKSSSNTTTEISHDPDDYDIDIYYEDYKDEFYDEDDAWDDFEDNEGWEDY